MAARRWDHATWDKLFRPSLSWNSKNNFFFTYSLRVTLVDSGLSGVSGGGRKRSAQQQVNYTVIVGMAEDEASGALLADAEVAEGLGPSTKDKYFRTLVRFVPDPYDSTWKRI